MAYRLVDNPDPSIDLQALLDWGIDLCKKLAVPISKHVTLGGVCKRMDFLAATDRFARNRFTITISTLAYKSYKHNTKKWQDLILHELLHTVRGCYNHHYKWKYWALYLNYFAGRKISPYPYSDKMADEGLD